MKIGIIITHPTQFDVPIFKLGKDVIEVIYTNRSRITEVYDPELKKIISFQQDNLEGYCYEIVPEKSGIRWLINKIKESNYDLLITNGYFNKFYIISLILGRFYAKKNAIRIDTVEYNNTGFFKRYYKSLIYYLIKLFVNQFFVVGELAKLFLIKNGVKENMIAYYGYISDNNLFINGSKLTSIEKYELRLKHNINEDKKIFLCISKHSLREAPFDTLEAFAKIDRPDLYLLLIGDGPLHEDLKKRAIELNIVNICFAGYINFNLLPKYYAISDVFIHDSHDEPWGVSVQEAIACGLSVIASNRVGSAYEMVIDGKNGFIFDVGDTDSLAKKIIAATHLNPVAKNKANLNVINRWNYANTLKSILETIN